jgi:hypothetical protein
MLFEHVGSTLRAAGDAEVWGTVEVLDCNFAREGKVQKKD